MEEKSIEQRFVAGLSPYYTKKFASLSVLGVKFEIVDDYWRVKVTYGSNDRIVEGVFISHAANHAVSAASEMMEKVSV